MQDRQTKTIVQVCRGADQTEKAPGPSKTHLLLGGGVYPAWHVLFCTGSTRAVQSLFKIVYNEKYSELVVLYSLGVWRRVCLRGKHFILINLDKYYRFY